MEKKIYIEGAERGSLFIEKEGMYTVLHGEISSDGELMRLYLQGGGEILPLGLMEPKGEKAVFRKRYSKMEMQKFPKKIEKALAVPYNQSPPMPEKSEKPKPQIIKIPEPQRKSEYWKEENGSLFFICAEGRFLALPAELRKKIPGLRLKKYKNRQYMLFRY